MKPIRPIVLVGSASVAALTPASMSAAEMLTEALHVPHAVFIPLFAVR